MLKIYSYNVNSIRARLDAVLNFLDQDQPDIIGFQETKVRDEEFPFEPFEELGYHTYIYGQKSYNGVAIMSKTEAKHIQNGYKKYDEEKQKRLIIGTFDLENGEEIHILNGYFPQGENRSHPTKFDDKKTFYADLMELLDERYSPQSNIIVMGDFNISPEDKDIGIGADNMKRWLAAGKCSFLPEEREILNQFKSWGFHDTFRKQNPEENAIFSWFDYRSKGFEANPKRGLRIDQIWATQSILEKTQNTGIDYAQRALEKPSDHCPIWVELNLDVL